MSSSATGFSIAGAFGVGAIFGAALAVRLLRAVLLEVERRPHPRRLPRDDD